MFSVAAWTSARRITADRSGLAAGLPIAAGAVPVVAIVVGSGAVPLTGIALVPVSGIVIGGAIEVIRPSASDALVPPLDQTRTVPASRRPASRTTAASGRLIE